MLLSSAIRTLIADTFSFPEHPVHAPHLHAASTDFRSKHRYRRMPLASGFGIPRPGDRRAAVLVLLAVPDLHIGILEVLQELCQCVQQRLGVGSPALNPEFRPLFRN
jgi:hypothetical protein